LEVPLLDQVAGAPEGERSRRTSNDHAGAVREDADRRASPGMPEVGLRLGNAASAGSWQLLLSSTGPTAGETYYVEFTQGDGVAPEAAGLLLERLAD
jgi:hypothetical protein